MRHLSRLFVTFLTLTSFACSPTAPAAPAAQAPSPSTPVPLVEQKLVIGASLLATNLDPMLAGTTGGFRVYDMFEPLVILNDEGKGVDPVLASEWKSTSPTTWRFTIRKDAKFHDGSLVTSADVEFSWKRVQDPASKSPVRGRLSGLTDMRAIDPSTVEVTTAAPDPLALKRVFHLAVVPKAYIDKVGADAFSKSPIGSGPYRFKEYKLDDRIVLTGWMEHTYRKPKLTEITVRVIPDGPVRTQALKLGEIDQAHQLTMEQGDGLKKEGFQVDVRPVAIYGTLLDGFVDGPLADKRVRQALNYALDRDTLAKTIFRGLVQPVGTPMFAGVVGYNPDVKPYTFDRPKAKELLAAAGYPNGFKIGLEFWSFNNEIQPTVLYMQSQFKEIGVEVELIPLEFAAYDDKLNKRRSPAPLFFNAGNAIIPYLDVDRAYLDYWSEAPTGKRYSNAEFDKVFLASRQELDAAKREQLLRQATAILQEDPPWLSLTTFAQVTAYKKTLTGVAPNSPLGDFTPFEKMARTR